MTKLSCSASTPSPAHPGLQGLVADQAWIWLLSGADPSKPECMGAGCPPAQLSTGCDTGAGLSMAPGRGAWTFLGRPEVCRPQPRGEVQGRRSRQATPLRQAPALLCICGSWALCRGRWHQAQPRPCWWGVGGKHRGGALGGSRGPVPGRPLPGCAALPHPPPGRAPPPARALCAGVLALSVADVMGSLVMPGLTRLELQLELVQPVTAPELWRCACNRPCLAGAGRGVRQRDIAHGGPDHGPRMRAAWSCRCERSCAGLLTRSGTLVNSWGQALQVLAFLATTSTHAGACRRHRRGSCWGSAGPPPPRRTSS